MSLGNVAPSITTPVLARTGRSPIAILLPSFFGGGAERVLINLACGLLARGVDVDLVVASNRGPYRDRLPPSLRVVDLGARRLVTALPALVSYLRASHARALISAMDLGNLVSVCARRWAGHHVVTVLTVHVDPKAMSVYEPPRGPARLSIPLIRWLYPKADAIVAVSRGVGDSLAVVTGIPRERIHVIHNPLVSAELTADAEHSPGHPWFDKPRLPVVLGVGRLVPQKDFDTLIRAFALVRQQARGRLLILGEGPERPRLMALISALGLESEVELLGFTGNPYAYMRRARLVVLSSTFEGFGNVLVEAMACGTPVVASRVSSLPEICGDAAILINPLSPGEIAEACRTILLDRARADELRARGFRNVLRFSWTESARELLRIFNECAAQHAGARRE